jgi:3-hydroxyacyl-CoA dehydrogenase
MKYRIDKAVVVGAGTMGAAIAAHLANAGVHVTLLDIVPKELTDEEKKKGLKLTDRAVRNRIVQVGFNAALNSRPASFFSKACAELVTLGNLEDDFNAVAEANWVIEVIIENLKIKQGLMTRIDKVRKENTIVSTNTSGIPVHSIAEGRSKGFRKHFLGTHFFNPPRYLKLLEIIPTTDTSQEVVDFICHFGEYQLGKGIVLCKDTPNFVANRVGSVAGAFALNYIIENGYTVPEVDSITGPIMGRPKTATFRLIDLVGIDVSNHVRDNLAELIPHDKIAQEELTSESGKITDALVEKGWLGNKSQIGFYKTVRENGNKEFWPLNLETLEHEKPGEKPRFDSIGKVKDIEDTNARVKALLNEDDRAAQLARAMIYHGLSYASHCIPEITDLPSAIDNATRWGFVHESGPFESWDAFGVKETAEKMKAEGYEPAAWVDEMLKAGKTTFYQYDGTTKIGIYNPAKKNYEPLKKAPGLIVLQSLKEDKKVVAKNDGASLIDLGDGIACLEFHTKMNSVDQDIGEMSLIAVEKLDTDFDGLVIGNQGPAFSAGANVFLLVMYAQQEQWDDINELLRNFQDINMRMRYSPKPVVAAPFGYTMGGGAEIMLHANRIVASSELYTGLVELMQGVIPAGGGTKEMLRRVLNPPMRTADAEPLPFIQQIFMQVGTVKVATSAVEAREMGMLGAADRIVMNGDHLIAEAKREARHMADAGYTSPPPEKIYAAGRDVLAAMRIGAFMFREGGYISDHDKLVAEKFAYALTGGDISRPQWVDEQYILDLEREAFLSLIGEKKTQERMWHFLQTGKPLRN